MKQIEQFDLFSWGEAYARRTDPSTSKEAAAAMESEATKLEGIVLDCLRQSAEFGGTTHEITAKTGLIYATVTPRIRPLVRKGLVLNSGQRRPSPSGKGCIVWKAT